MLGVTPAQSSCVDQELEQASASFCVLHSEMARACSFLATLVIFGISVQDVLQDSSSDVARDMDVLDLFCGAAAIHRAALDSGLASTAFDKFRVPGITDSSEAGRTEDLSSKNGFMRALKLVKRLRTGGLLVMGPPCSSFVMLNAVKCRRKADNNYQGDLNYPPVQLGNLLATAAAFLMTVACMRAVEVVFENPPCSTIWKFPIVKQVLDFFVLRSSCTPRCAWSTEPWGKRMLKRFKFACTGGWISHIHRPCRCPGRRHLRLTRSVWSNGKLKFTGKRRELKNSAAYPDALGKAIVNAWRQGIASASVQSTFCSAWLEPCPGARNGLVDKGSKAERRAGTKKTRRPLHASDSSLAWLQPCPGCTSAALPSEPIWLQPRAGTANELIPSSKRSDSGAPAWLNPAPSSR